MKATTKVQKKDSQLRYGIIGLGHIAQTAVIPAFRNARKNSVLTTLISEDPKKLKVLSKKYNINNTFLESEFDKALSSGSMDVLYIATPNTDHTRYIVKALKAGIHVLTEKPLSTNVHDCLLVQSVLEKNPQSKLMVGYRLHFDPANLSAVEEAQKASFGQTKCFSSVFSYQIKDKNNIRLQHEKGGGPLLDIGIYCINAARYLFRAEPTEVFAMTTASEKDSRFDEVNEMISVMMRFPEGRIAQFTCSFGMYQSADFTLIGDHGRIDLEKAYEYTEDMKLHIETDNKEKSKVFKKHDQFAPELIYFSECVLKNKQPEPSVKEALHDLRIIEAIKKSAKTGKRVFIDSLKSRSYPKISMKMAKPRISRPPQPVHATSPSK